MAPDWFIKYFSQGAMDCVLVDQVESSDAFVPIENVILEPKDPDGVILGEFRVLLLTF